MSASTAISDVFVETLEHRRFVEFCDACCQYRYIGLCYGRPGVGKTVSARRYAHWDVLEKVDVYRITDSELQALDTPTTVFYTPGVINTPRSISDEIQRWRSRLRSIVLEPLGRAERRQRDKLRTEYERAQL